MLLFLIITSRSLSTSFLSSLDDLPYSVWSLWGHSQFCSLLVQPSLWHLSKENIFAHLCVAVPRRFDTRKRGGRMRKHCRYFFVHIMFPFPLLRLRRQMLCWRAVKSTLKQASCNWPRHKSAQHLRLQLPCIMTALTTTHFTAQVAIQWEYHGFDRNSVILMGPFSVTCVAAFVKSFGTV